MNTLLNIFLVGAPAGGAQGGGSNFMTFLPMIAIVVVFYFFMIRPQMKRQKEARKFREALKKGDNVLTTGGIHGTITEVGDTWFKVEIDRAVNIKIEKSAVVQGVADLPKN